VRRGRNELPRKGLPFKACRNCHYLVNEDAVKCPICNSKDFSDEWSGMVIILDVNSETAKLLNKKEPGRYAIEDH
jgi:DNA-directed RNA polymerase subunit E"